MVVQMRIPYTKLVRLCLDKALETSTNWKSKLLKTLFFSLRSWFFDVQYDTCSLEELHTALKEFKQIIESYGIEYIPDSFDCDDYASAFKSWFTLITRKNSVGIAIGKVYYNGVPLGYHAWNIVLLTGGVLAFVEPQIFEVFTSNVSPDGFTYELEAVIW